MMISGKQKTISYSTNEATLNLTNTAKRELQVVFRILMREWLSVT
jgi:hypothetical protein